MSSYYKEAEVNPLIREYLLIKEKNTPEARVLAEKIMTEVQKICSAIIFTHRYSCFGDYDDLMQTAMLACWSALHRFNPDYQSQVTGKTVTSFNYFSLVAKNCLLYNTLRDKTNRNNFSVDDFAVWKNNSQDTSQAVDNIIQQILTIYLDTEWSRHARIFCKYLVESGEYNRRFFITYSKSYGYSPCGTRKFLTDLKTRKELYLDVDTGITIESEHTSQGESLIGQF